VRFNIGDWVVIHPRYSLRFALRLGRIIDIAESDDALPFKIAFHKEGSLYGFSYQELISKTEFEREVIKPVSCYYCGKDITGQFSLYCEECEYPIEGE
jgi:hypothetical protein